MAKKIAMILGWILIVIGILGFIPGITSGGMFIGIFGVGVWFNVGYIIAGIVSVLCSRSGDQMARTCTIWLGVIFAVIAIWGFITSTIIWFIPVNMADNWLNVIVALIYLYVGFLGEKSITKNSDPTEGGQPQQDEGSINDNTGSSM